MNWSKEVIDFGNSKVNETKYDSIQYLGNQIISSSNFLTSCGCTGVTYNPETKLANIGLNMTHSGTKSASVIVNYPDGTQDIITLKAEIAL